MPSETSSFKLKSGWFSGTLFVKNAKRFWPIWVLYSLGWVLTLIVPLMSRARYFGEGNPYGLRLFMLGHMSGNVLLSAVMGLGCAMAVFSYLYNSRSTGFYHSLPMRREGLFLTNYLSGASFFLVPILAVALLTGAVECITCGFELSSLFVWTWNQCFSTLFFYSFAVFCAMFTGHILALPIFYAILNFLVMCMTDGLNQVIRPFLYGYTSNSLFNSMGDLVMWLTPYLKIGRDVGYITNEDGMPIPTGMMTAFLYGLAGLALAALAVEVYRRRQLERAGDVVTVEWVRPVFKYGIAFCSAVVGGLLLQSILSSLLGDGPVVWVVLMMIMGAVGYFVAEMLLKKSFRVFGAWKGCAVFLGIVAALGLMLGFDLMGYVHRVPDAGQVASVNIWMGNSVPYDSFNSGTVTLNDPEQIRQVVGIHSAIISDQWDRRDQAEARENAPHPAVEMDGYYAETMGHTTVNICYTMKDGSSLERKYTIPVYQEDLDIPDSPTALLYGLIQDPSYVEIAYFGALPEAATLDSIQLLYHVRDTEGQSSYANYAPSGSVQAIYDAIRQDMAEGHIGTHYLFEGEERYTNCYVQDLELSFRIPSDQYKTVEYFADKGVYLVESTPESGVIVDITIQASSVRTLQALMDAGMIESPDDLLLHAERAAAD